MKNRLYSSHEINRIRYNLDKIEENLGHTIPGGILNINDYKDSLLSEGEAVRISENLRKIERDSVTNRSTFDSSSTSSGMARFVLVAAVVGLIIALFADMILGTNIL